MYLMHFDSYKKHSLYVFASSCMFVKYYLCVENVKHIYGLQHNVLKFVSFIILENFIRVKMFKGKNVLIYNQKF
jgi:hypothetical protein